MVFSRTSERFPRNTNFVAWAVLFCSFQAIHTMPTGLSSELPLGPAIPVTATTS